MTNEKQSTELKELDEACRHLLESAHRFWKLQEKITDSGAVKWVTFHDGSVLVFTRGEYKDQLMRNIEPLSGPLTFVDKRAPQEREVEND